MPQSERRISVRSKLSDCFASRCCPCSGGAVDNAGQCVYKAAFVLEHIMLTENIAKMNELTINIEKQVRKHNREKH